MSRRFFLALISALRAKGFIPKQSDRESESRIVASMRCSGNDCWRIEYRSGTVVASNRTSLNYPMERYFEVLHIHEASQGHSEWVHPEIFKTKQDFLDWLEQQEKYLQHPESWPWGNDVARPEAALISEIRAVSCMANTCFEGAD